MPARDRLPPGRAGRRAMRRSGHAIRAVLLMGLALSCGAALQAAEPARNAAGAARATPALAGDAAAPATSGEAVYARWCVHCHAAGRGNPGTESLQAKYRGQLPAVLLERSDLTAEAVTLFVRQGVLSMPPFRKTEITDAELAALSAFVTGRRAPR